MNSDYKQAAWYNLLRLGVVASWLAIIPGLAGMKYAESERNDLNDDSNVVEVTPENAPTAFEDLTELHDAEHELVIDIQSSYTLPSYANWLSDEPANFNNFSSLAEIEAYLHKNYVEVGFKGYVLNAETNELTLLGYNDIDGQPTYVTQSVHADEVLNASVAESYNDIYKMFDRAKGEYGDDAGYILLHFGDDYGFEMKMGSAVNPLTFNEVAIACNVNASKMDQDFSIACLPFAKESADVETIKYREKILEDGTRAVYFNRSISSYKFMQNLAKDAGVSGYLYHPAQDNLELTVYQMVNGQPMDLYTFPKDDVLASEAVQSSAVFNDMQANNPRINPQTACADCYNILYLPENNKVDVKANSKDNSFLFEAFGQICTADTSDIRFGNHDFYEGFSRFQQVQMRCTDVAKVAGLNNG